MTKFLPFLMLVLCGCIGAHSTQSRWVEDAIAVNNEIVKQLAGVQDTARAKRKAAMITAANTAGSLEEGRAALDKIGSDFQPLFDMFTEIERVQSALAAALKAARAALRAGDDVLLNMEDLVSLYSELQRLYSKSAKLLGEL